MEKIFRGVVAIVTGSASGLGAKCALGLANAGASIVLVDISTPMLEVTAAMIRQESGMNIQSVSGDVGDAGTAERAVALAVAAGGPHVLINNAAIDPLDARSVTNTSEALWDAVMAVNVKGAFLFSKAAIPAMIAVGGGAIVNVASISAILPSAHETAYSVSKAAVVQLTRATALDYAVNGVRANCVCPGMLEAVMSDRLTSLTDDAVAARSAAATAAVPMQREGHYAEIVEAILFLASRRSSYTTGATLVVDGGLTLR